MPVLFTTISLISVTMAWFAYGGLAGANVDIGVKAWNIELTRNNQKETNDIVVSFKDIHPGMDTVSEIVNIKNLGDSDAEINYSIVSAKILGDPKNNFVVNKDITSEYVEDKLSHEYPFHINAALTNSIAPAKTGESEFKVSISWPLDSGDNKKDSEWGAAAFNYKNDSPIQIVISITAEQYIKEEGIDDVNYPIGKSVLYDVSTNNFCSSSNSTCLDTQVIGVTANRKNLFDKNNPNVFDGYISESWKTMEQSSLSKTVYIEIKPNTTYTISREIIDDPFSIATTLIPPVYGTSTKVNVKNTTASSITITTGENDKYLCVWIYGKPTGETHTFEEKLDKLQIEEGNLPTEYESFKRIGFKTIYLLPKTSDSFSSSTFNNYNTTFKNITNSWKVTKRELNIKDVLNIISSDITDSVLIRPNLSNSIIGNLKYNGRDDIELEKTISSSGHYSFLNSKFPYFVSNNCYWINKVYDETKAFAGIKESETNSKIYGEVKTNSCKVVPIIEVEIENKN